MTAATDTFEPSRAHQTWRRWKSRGMSVLLGVCAVAVISPLFLVLYFLVSKGASALDWNFFTQLPKPTGELGGGMANAIVGTLMLLGMAAVVGVPIGVMGGVYLAEYGSDRANYWIRFAADVLNGIPSIVWGVVVWALLVVPFKTFSAYAGGAALGFMMIPLIMRTTEEVLVLVPQSYREAGLALGIARWKIITVIVIKTALKGIITGILIATARIAGETAPLLFTALGNNFWNHNLSEPIAALPLQIYNYAISPYDDWHRQAWAGALVLMGMILTLNIIVRVISRGHNKSN
ncbi:MAG TPA: phosphate ABC transporter permease PstA [Opitutaceae bacterium]|jgi:phosphate transport system permease protein|nr:phosphate ABC transporter permease PstA [Opitutaceae bacterium]HXB02625.1 phosphate ABC transporter permease PstA [Opitutaceae bacterium]